MEIPNEIMKKICLYRVFSPHPVAILFKQAFDETIYDLNENEYDLESYCIADDMSFARYRFYLDKDKHVLRKFSKHVYIYAYMDYDYVSTLNEYARNRVGDYYPFYN